MAKCLLRGNRLAFVILLILAVGLSGCFGGGSGEKKYNVTVVVLDGEKPLPGVDVAYYGPNDDSGTGITNSHGEVLLSGLNGQIEIRFLKDGYDFYPDALVVDRAGTYYVDAKRTEPDTKYDVKVVVKEGESPLSGVEVIYHGANIETKNLLTDGSGEVVLRDLEGHIEVLFLKDGYDFYPDALVVDRAGTYYVDAQRTELDTKYDITVVVKEGESPLSGVEVVYKVLSSLEPGYLTTNSRGEVVLNGLIEPIEILFYKEGYQFKPDAIFVNRGGTYYVDAITVVGDPPLIRVSETNPYNRKEGVYFTIDQKEGTTFYYAVVADGEPTPPIEEWRTYGGKVIVTPPDISAERVVTIYAFGVRDGLRSEISEERITYAKPIRGLAFAAGSTNGFDHPNRSAAGATFRAVSAVEGVTISYKILDAATGIETGFLPATPVHSSEPSEAVIRVPAPDTDEGKLLIISIYGTKPGYYTEAITSSACFAPIAPKISVGKSNADNRDAGVTFTIAPMSGVKFFYTLDGSDPRDGGAIHYTGRVTIPPPNSDQETKVVVKAYGFFSGSWDSGNPNYSIGGWAYSEVSQRTVTYAKKAYSSQAEALINRAYQELGNTNGSKYGHSTAWCAYFISWCARQEGIPTSVIRHAGGASSDTMLGPGCYVDKSTGYIPKRGDLVIYDWNGDHGGRSNKGDHVGIVTRVDSNYVYTIEGNYVGRVVERRVALDNRYIQGYGRPKYQY